MMTVSDASLATTHERRERTVDVQGIQTHLFEAGPPTAAPLLYLHGTHLGNLWLDYHNALAQHFHVFAPDTPGFGLTKRPDWMRDMSDYILYFRDLMNVLGLERPLIVGHSLGGGWRQSLPSGIPNGSASWFYPTPQVSASYRHGILQLQYQSCHQS